MRTSWRAVVGTFVLAFTGIAHGAFYGLNPFVNDNSALPQSAGLLTLNQATGAITGGTVITVPAFTIIGANGITVDPTTGVVYAVVRANAVAGRLLITLDVTTGVGALVGNLGDNFASIAFRGDGQLFGVTGNGATVPETLFTIDKATAVPTLATALGAGADGEVIAFNWADGNFYHWSGGTSFFERVLPTVPYTVTPITSTFNREVFGAAWDGSINQFLVHDIASIMTFWTTAGVVSNQQAATLADVRGMLLAFTATPNAPANGTVSPAGPVLVASGAPFSFTLTPDPGFAVQSVGGTCTGTLVGNVYTTNAVTADCTVTAVFVVAAAAGPTMIPTMSEWTLMILATLMLAVGVAGIRRRL